MSRFRRIGARRRAYGIPTPVAAVPDLAGQYQVREGRKVILIDAATGEVVKTKVGKFWDDVPVREERA